MDKLNKKLAEWAGFKYLDLMDDEYKNHSPRDWRYPNFTYEMWLPNFTESLDACFKWLVPKAKRILDARDMTGYYKFLIAWAMDIDDGKDEALFLCLALERMIDGEGK
ncbi:hypothetical protein LCGC14_1692160 [marine sediment metagenome]|uniref:Phage ABA sandwich domain-containing protein n=1 Tax=marine sediment metagenome TaxID=412755 RepID=A0A0F9HKF4_9ZZZZ